MGTKIVAINTYLPEKIITNQQLENDFKRWDSEKIEAKLGIRNRHVVKDDETALDLAYNASLKTIKEYDKNKIDFVILCTQSPDYFLPSGACILQNKLGLRTNIGAFDFNLGCSGYIYGLAIAKGLINNNLANSILLIMSETYSKHIHKKDLANLTIFGDGAASTIIEKSENEHILEFVFGTDGSGFENLIVKNGAFRKKYDPNAPQISDNSGNIWTDNNLFMNGPEIFNFTIEKVPKLVDEILNKNEMTLNDIDFIIFHQANKYIIEYLRRKINIPKEKFYSNMLDTGNTVSVTIPLALEYSINNKIIKRGDKVLLCGFGVGYSWGATIIKF